MKSRSSQTTMMIRWKASSATIRSSLPGSARSPHPTSARRLPATDRFASRHGHPIPPNTLRVPPDARRSARHQRFGGQMITTRTTALHDLFGESFRALTPAAADVDRPRLMRRLKRAARMLQEASDPLIAHLRRSGFRESRVVAYTHRPFDTRWLYADPSADFNYLAHVAAPNQFIVASAACAFVTRRATIEQSSPASLFPLYRVRRDGHAASLTEEAREFVRRNGIAESDLFHHAVAMVVG